MERSINYTRSCGSVASRTPRRPAAVDIGPVRLSSSERAIGAITVALMFIALTAAAVGAVERPVRPAATAWTHVSVGPNGTLWEIASQNPVAGLTTSETVELIKTQNSLTSSALYAGQTLRVPAVSSAALAVARR